MSFIEDELNRAIDEAASTGLDWCVTLESKRNPDYWIQLTREYINIHYPLQNDPASTLVELDWPIDGLELDGWESETYVTFAHHAGISISMVSKFIRRYIAHVFQELPERDEWTFSEEAL